jgi:hypothetical protein
MGIFDKAKDALSSHPDQVDSGVEKLADLVDERTGHQHSGQIDKAEHFADERLEDYLRKDQPPA